MYDTKQTIHYCTILSSEQWDFLLAGRFSLIRQKCLYRLMSAAVRTRTTYSIKGIGIALEVGQVAASDVELAEYLGCNRKTVGKLIDSFNRLGMLTTRANNRTSVHTLHFLTGWYVGGVLITNPHYVKPSATVKGVSEYTRTPLSKDFLPGNGQHTMPDDCHAQEPDADSREDGDSAFSFPLISPVIPGRTEDGRANSPEADISPVMDRDPGRPGNHPAESPKGTRIDPLGTPADADTLPATDGRTGGV